MICQIMPLGEKMLQQQNFTVNTAFAILHDEMYFYLLSAICLCLTL